MAISIVGVNLSKSVFPLSLPVEPDKVSAEVQSSVSKTPFNSSTYCAFQHTPADS
jgi:hypothetical protein